MKYTPNHTLALTQYVSSLLVNAVSSHSKGERSEPLRPSRKLNAAITRELNPPPKA